MAISTMFTFLMHKASTSYSKLLDIKSFPDMGGAPESIETTTLSDWMQKFIDGVQSNESKDFTCNYDLADYKKIKDLEGEEQDFSLWLGGTKASDGSVTPTGTYGKYNFSGKISVYLNGGDVNAVTEMTVTVVPTTAITLATE